MFIKILFLTILCSFMVPFSVSFAMEDGEGKGKTKKSSSLPFRRSHFLLPPSPFPQDRHSSTTSTAAASKEELEDLLNKRDKKMGQLIRKVLELRQSKNPNESKESKNDFLEKIIRSYNNLPSDEQIEEFTKEPEKFLRILEESGITYVDIPPRASSKLPHQTTESRQGKERAQPTLTYDWNRRRSLVLNPERVLLNPIVNGTIAILRGIEKHPPSSYLTPLLPSFPQNSPPTKATSVQLWLIEAERDIRHGRFPLGIQTWLGDKTASLVKKF